MNVKKTNRNIICDIKYKTNKNYQSLGVFVGFNNHK